MYKTYSFREASKLILCDRFHYNGKKESVLINMIMSAGIIKRIPKDISKYSPDYWRRDKWVLTETVKQNHPEVYDYFEECVFNGYYQLKITEYGIENLIDYIYELEQEVINNDREQF